MTWERIFNVSIDLNVVFEYLSMKKLNIILEIFVLGVCGMVAHWSYIHVYHPAVFMLSCSLITVSFFIAARRRCFTVQVFEVRSHVLSRRSHSRIHQTTTETVSPTADQWGGQHGKRQTHCYAFMTCWRHLCPCRQSTPKWIFFVYDNFCSIWLSSSKYFTVTFVRRMETCFWKNRYFLFLFDTPEFIL